MSAPHSTRARPAPRGGGFRGEPNPLLVRELRQAMRMPRLPWQIAAVVALVGLGMLSIGSVEGSKGRPAELGVVLFQGFVSILFLYVALMAPAAAAGAIATEREGRTLEPLLLTGLSSRDIARGKFLAAYGTIGLQVLALFPLAAIPFLFGGVTAFELVVAMIYVMVVAALGVAFGLAVASRTQTLRAALAVSIVVPAAMIPFAFGIVVAIGDEVRRHKWPTLLGQGPIWWAGAYTSVPFGLDYVLWLVLWPLVVLGLPLWLFSTLAATNLAGSNDDRSTGPKRWFLGSTAAISIVGFLTCFRVEADTAVGAAIVTQVLIAVLATIGVSLVVGEPLAPSRLVRARWERQGAGPIRRFLGPGLIRGAVLLIACVSVALLSCWIGGVLGSQPGGLRNVIGVASTTSGRSGVGSALAIVVLYTLTFAVFLVGLGAFLRTRKGSSSPAVARAWTLASAILATIVPWIAVAILASFDGSPGTSRFAAPSPVFAYRAFDVELRRYGEGVDYTIAALAAALAWGAIGLVLLGVAWERARRAIALEERALALTERKLDEEGDDDEEEEEPVPQAPPLPGARATSGEVAAAGHEPARVAEGHEEP